MKYVSQVVFVYDDNGIIFSASNKYNFYSKHLKKKLKCKYKISSIGCLKEIIIVMPCLKTCKKDRFIRVCKKLSDNLKEIK